jgi:hypothetical protein
MADRLVIFLVVFLVSQHTPAVTPVLPIIALELLNGKTGDKKT